MSWARWLNRVAHNRNDLTTQFNIRCDRMQASVKVVKESKKVCGLTMKGSGYHYFTHLRRVWRGCHVCAPPLAVPITRSIAHRQIDQSKPNQRDKNSDCLPSYVLYNSRTVTCLRSRCKAPHSTATAISPKNEEFTSVRCSPPIPLLRRAPIICSTCKRKRRRNYTFFGDAHRKRIMEHITTTTRVTTVEVSIEAAAVMGKPSGIVHSSPLK